MTISVSLPVARERRSAPAVLPRLRAVPVYAWLGLLVLLPNLLMVGFSFASVKDGQFDFTPSLANYTRIMGSRGVWLLLMRTISVSLLSSLIAALIAYPMALYASRLRRGKTIALMLVIVPLWISVLMRVFSWRIILGENGVINSLLMQGGLIAKPIDALLYNSFAVFLTFAYVAIPFIFVSVFTVVDRIPASLAQAASDCGATPFKVFWTVTWPLSKPGVAIGYSLAFLIAIGDYVTPSIVGGLEGTMIGTVIASQFGIAGNWPFGSALAVTLLLLVCAVLGVIFALARIKGSAQGDAAGEPAVPAASEAARVRGLAGFGLFCLPYVFLYAPLVLLAVFSFNDSPVQALPLHGATLKWYRSMLQNAPMLAALRESMIVGLTVLAVSIVVGTGFAVLLAVGKLRFSGAIEKLLLVPVIFPGVILGIALVLAFQLLHVPAGLPRLVLGHCTFVMPVVMSLVIDRLKRLDPALVEASMDLGAPPLTTLVHVVLPLVKSAILSGALLGFTLSVDEVVVSSFLVGSQPTLPVWVFNQMRFGFTPAVNAIFVCIGLTTFGFVIASQALSRAR